MLREVTVKGWEMVETTRIFTAVVRASHAAKSIASVPAELGLHDTRMRIGVLGTPLGREASDGHGDFLAIHLKFRSCFP